jgi:two-component system invasion response regulator UvrY
MLRILIADDHALILHGLKRIISDNFADATVFEAATSAEALSALRENPIDVVILDIVMPGMDGVEVLKEIKKAYPKVSVLMLSMHPEERFAVRAFRSGASGYLTKDSAPDDLARAIKTVLGGNKFITPSIAELLANNLEGDTADKKALAQTLSDREFQVFRLLASGKTVGEAAEELSLSVNTVSTYRTRILEKLDLKTNAELTYFAISHELIDKDMK